MTTRRFPRSLSDAFPSDRAPAGDPEVMAVLQPDDLARLYEGHINFDDDAPLVGPWFVIKVIAQFVGIVAATGFAVGYIDGLF